ncbi:MAG TPA: response regulator [Thermomicrobiales bacterium]|jgi:DNA-binding response OmpR family regulator|nr:response regulator [Thermomicrobiales bacterium]
MTNDETFSDEQHDLPAQPGGETTTPQLLVVEDDSDLRGLLSTALKEAGFAVRTAEDGMAALAELRREIPDAVITDVAMPRLSGDRLAADLADWGLPVILTSGRRDDPGLPGTTFLRKPFDLDDLVEAVNDAVAATSPPPPPHGQSTNGHS